MRLGIIILVTRTQTLSYCLTKLIHQTYDHGQFEIILVKAENCNVELPATDIKIIQVIENDLHLCVRRNEGVRSTQAELIAFIDDDAIPPIHWVESAIENISKYRCDGVCGPLLHFTENTSLAHRLASAVTDSFFLEGFEERADKSHSVPFYNIPLCNCVIKRGIWEAVGGFNEHMYYYMDDLEFFYIASSLGFSFYVVPNLGVQHNVEPFPGPYLRKKIITRFNAGINTVLFNEIYRKIPFIKLAIIAYGLLIVVFVFSKTPQIILGGLGGVYLLLAFIYSMKFLKKHFLVFLLLPFVFIIVHLAIFPSFTIGILTALIFRKKYQSVIICKTERLRVCPN